MYNWKLHTGESKHHSASNLWSACNTQREWQAGRLGQCTSLDIESGIRLTSDRNDRWSAEYEQARSRVTRSGHSAMHQVDALGSISGGFDWCCFYYFVRNSLVALLEALCARIFSWDSWISVFPDIWFSVFSCVCARSLTNSFFHSSQPDSCAWLSIFLLCADGTCVLVCVCLCMCMWKCVGKVINIWQI